MSISSEINLKGYSNADIRWSRFGPYYAMFPFDFAIDVVKRYSKKGETVIDPFAGRFSAPYAAAALGRKAIGIEINPLGWLYGNTKLNPAPQDKVLFRLKEIYELSKKHFFHYDEKELSDFFHICFNRETLSFLLCAKKYLNWRNDSVDGTLMAFISVYLHGKRDASLSNSMQITKAMGPIYSVNWWKSHNMEIPPEINPYYFLKSRIEWRYKKGIPKFESNSTAILGDSVSELKKLREKNISLLFTSPPYFNITNYHVDQWLRLWLLGENYIYTNDNYSNEKKHKGRFNNKDLYEKLLLDVFSTCANFMAEKSTVFVRTDARKYTLETTKKILQEVFPNHKLLLKEQKVDKVRTQTDLFSNKSNKPGEIDLILSS